MKLIEDVPKWVAIAYLILFKLDTWIYDAAWNIEQWTYTLTVWREKLRAKYCTCEQCIERKRKDESKHQNTNT